MNSSKQSLRNPVSPGRRDSKLSQTARGKKRRVIGSDNDDGRVAQVSPKQPFCAFEDNISRPDKRIRIQDTTHPASGGPDAALDSQIFTLNIVTIQTALRVLVTVRKVMSDSKKLKVVDSLQATIQETIGINGVANIIVSGLRSEKLIAEIRNTNTASRQTIKDCDIITLSAEWAIRGVYYDIGECGFELRRNAGYAGSGSGFKKVRVKGINTLGLTTRIFGNHENPSYRASHPDTHHYLQGYPTDSPHTYACLWAATEEELTSYLGPYGLLKPGMKEEDRNEICQAMTGLVEATMILILGMHAPSVVQNACAKHGLKIPTRLRPLNLASGLERGGELWDSTTGAEAGRLARLAWGKKMGKHGQEVSLTDYHRFMKGDDAVRESKSRGAKSSHESYISDWLKGTKKAKLGGNIEPQLDITSQPAMIAHIRSKFRDTLTSTQQRRFPPAYLRLPMPWVSISKRTVVPGLTLLWKVADSGGLFRPEDVIITGSLNDEVLVLISLDIMEKSEKARLVECARRTDDTTLDFRFKVIVEVFRGWRDGIGTTSSSATKTKKVQHTAENEEEV